MQYRKYNKICMTCFMIGLLLVVMIIVYVDPCFHYHAPFGKISYLLGGYNDERYINNGIVRNFEYDAIITGTSVTESFKTTEMDDIFGVNSIKVPYSEGHYKEINDNIVIALANNTDIILVLRALDISYMFLDKDAELVKPGYIYPYFMNDNNPFNDVAYVLNKEWLLRGLDNVLYTLGGGMSTSFDEYAYWYGCQVGAEAVLSSYHRGEKIDYVSELTEEDKVRILGNITQNVTDAAGSNPDVEFYLFYPPYNIVWWDRINNQGSINYYIDAMELATEEILKYDNIKLYDFCSNYALICNLDNYVDVWHYSPEINTNILYWIREDEYLLTTDNYKEHFDELRDFYYNYDYDGFFNRIAAEEGVE